MLVFAALAGLLAMGGGVLSAGALAAGGVSAGGAISATALGFPTLLTSRLLITVLTPAMLAAIDQGLIAGVTSSRARRVARMIGTFMDAHVAAVPGLPDYYYLMRIENMIDSGLLARRAKQYVLLNKWDFGDDSCNPKGPVSRFNGVSSQRAAPSASPLGSANGSGNHGVTAYAARGAR